MVELSEKQKTYLYSEEHLERLKKQGFQKGQTPWDKGVKRPDISAKLKNRKMTWGDKVSKARKGQHNSPETEFTSERAKEMWTPEECMDEFAKRFEKIINKEDEGMLK